MNDEAVPWPRPAILGQTGLFSADAGLQATATRSNENSFFWSGVGGRTWTLDTRTGKISHSEEDTPTA